MFQAKTNLFLWTLLFVSFINYGQSNADIPEPNQLTDVTFDLDTGKLSSELPFDRYFRFFIKSKKKIGPKIDVFEMVYRDGLRLPRIYIKNDSDFEADYHQLELKTVNDELGAYATIPPLKPNKLYEIVIVITPNNAVLSNLYDIIHEIRSDTAAARKKFNEKIEPLEKTKRRTVDIQHLQPFEKLRDSAQMTYIPLIDGFEESHLHEFSNVIPLQVIERIGSKLVEYELEVKDYQEIIFPFSQRDSVHIREILSGVRSFGKGDPVKLYDYHARAENIKNSLSKINAFQTLLERLLIVDGHPAIRSFYQGDYLILKDSLAHNRAVISGLTDRINPGLTTNFSYNELISASTESSNVETRNATYLVTDFGITNSLAYDPNGDIKYIGRPHFGVNWHLGGIDKDQKLKHIVDKRFWHRASIAVGVTLGKIDENGYTDLFNNISPTLGMNYRFAQQVRVGGGVLFLMEKDNNPVIDDKHLEVAPYVSLSFDFSLFNSLGKLAGNVFK
ncbi:MAG: hypothetical protein AAFP76_09430 [Bacteroidota bacterium]